MSFIVVGLNHKTAPVDVLERLSIPEDDLVKALGQLCNYDHVLEGAILSTCNRVELYSVVSKFHAGAQDLRNLFAEFCHVAPEDIVDHLYTYHDEHAVQHLFRVAAGLDSMVLGESEILGQVRRAYQVAEEEGTVGRLLGMAFRRALRVGKRARTETAIGRNPVSVSSAAVDLARRTFASGDLVGKRVAIVGAGKMGTLAAKALKASGATEVTVLNRTEERARELAEQFEGRALTLGRLPEVLAWTDILICSTDAPSPLIERSMVEDALAARGDRELFIVDIAVPRDVEASVGNIPGVVLRDIDDLRDVVDSNMGNRMVEVSKVEAVVAEELDRYLGWERQTEVAPTVSAIVEKVDDIRRAELEKSATKLAGLTAEQRDAIDHLTRRLVSKSLHGPIKRLKEFGDTKQGHVYLGAIRELYELDDTDDPDE